MGEKDRVEKVEVRWPSGDVQHFGPLDAGYLYDVVEGSVALTKRPLTPRKEIPAGGGLNADNRARLHSTWFWEPVPIPVKVKGPALLVLHAGESLPTWTVPVSPIDLRKAATDTAAAPWRDLAAGSHWENQAEDLKQYTGIAWYRVDVEIPADWPEVDSRAVFEGVDDSFELWLDGESLGRRGDPATKTTIWLEPQVLELGRRLRPGRHSLTLRVVDHAGSGGLWKPASITTGPVGEVRRLLQ